MNYLEYNLQKAGTLIGELLLPLGGAELYAKTPQPGRAELTILTIRQLQADLNQHCGLPLTLKAAGVLRDNLAQIAAATMDDGALTFNPEAVDQADALSVLQRAYE